MTVLDASALLAHLLGEPGGERVKDELSSARMSSVNFAETLTRLSRLGGDVVADAKVILALGVKIVDASGDQARMAAALDSVTKTAGLSIGDRFCLALALELDATVLTADRSWLRLPHGANVVSIR